MSQAVNPTHQSHQCIAPFGPLIVKSKMPLDVFGYLITAFENNATATDFAPALAGNISREFEITAETLGGEEKGNKFAQMIADGSGELYKNSVARDWECIRDATVPKHREIVDPRMNSMDLEINIAHTWGNISIAGDWNPIHQHTNQMTGVGYLRMPDGIEEEWLDEDQDPSAACIQFIGSVPQPLTSHSIKLKPVVGDIYFFPGHVQHTVYPFRSRGERWSFSFNVRVTNQKPDITLTEDDKREIYKAREEMRNAGSNG